MTLENVLWILVAFGVFLLMFFPLGRAILKVVVGLLVKVFKALLKAFLFAVSKTNGWITTCIMILLVIWFIDDFLSIYNPSHADIGGVLMEKVAGMFMLIAFAAFALYAVKSHKDTYKGPDHH